MNNHVLEDDNLMRKRILETKNQVKLKLYTDYLEKNNIKYKTKFDCLFSQSYRIYIDKKDFPKINEKDILGDMYGSIEKSYFGVTEFPNKKDN